VRLRSLKVPFLCILIASFIHYKIWNSDLSTAYPHQNHKDLISYKSIWMSFSCKFLHYIGVVMPTYFNSCTKTALLFCVKTCLIVKDAFVLHTKLLANILVFESLYFHFPLKFHAFVTSNTFGCNYVFLDNSFALL
jgi:hypothetical protein